MQYAFRRSIIEKETTCTLDESGIHASTEGREPVFISYDDIARISLHYSPSRFFTNRYTCSIHSKAGGKIDLQNNSYDGIGKFLDLSVAYRVFVTELHEKIKHIRGIEFSRGDTGLKYGCYCLLVAFAVLLVAYVLIAFGPCSGFIVLIKFVFFLFLLIYSVRYLRQNRPGSYDPDSIPKDLLPRLFK